VAVALRVVAAGGGDAVAVESLGDCPDAGARDVLGEDAPHDLGGNRVDLETAKALTVRRLARVRMRTGIADRVAVGRSTTEKPPFVLSLRLHGGLDSHLDPVPLAFRHAAVESHD
jgi:hypothetical protein